MQMFLRTTAPRNSAVVAYSNCQDIDTVQHVMTPPSQMGVAVLSVGRPTRRNKSWNPGLSRKASMLGSR